MVPADVQLGQVVDPSVPQLLVGDHTHLARVVEHLVGNALKFTHRGHVTVAARARERHGDTLLLEVTVRDTGVGIAPDTLKHLFDPLTAGDMSATRQFGGIGLGLSLCQRLAQLMDARLEASSTPGQGSIFRLLAPVGIGSTLVTPSPLPRLVSNHSLHVLLAEDNAINRRYAEALLRKLGHTVESVGDGFEALRAMERRSWDVVLMDLQMPRCSGLEAVQQLRAREANGQSHQVVLAVTAWARADERTDFLARGFDGLVPKPFDATSLMGELRRALDLAA
jgi:CheY-like chemotaxis protein/anti-sigma regulatory factor (Ser/Thr protein kinase)